ncbi:hypothetical protein BFP97_01505 [Roseivirga sp. 4D4]|uniref:hypothetical protein n=1 Tax=Roseivirga sp. 4D4 TaxID=1889784 RepID=UPI0008530CE9|nr:hypothetical protein [Roseivirga sp. 4D4]OEK00267.1 hypothetical protein BFP97_01505 [Roseivirga sp. 4D4]
MNSKERSYSNVLRVNTLDETAFEALSIKIGDWWGDQDKPAQGLGDVFTMSWGEPWYKFKVVAFEPNEKIVWECIDSKQIIGGLAGVEKEWVGTQLQWTINKLNEDEIELQFRHEGLVPEFLCYDFCSHTWDRFIDFNLKKYLEGS